MSIAEDIIKKFTDEKLSKDNLKIRQSEFAFEMCKKIWNDQAFQLAAAQDYQRIKKGFPPMVNLPTWGYKVAYVMMDDGSAYSSDTKEGLLDYLELMMEEFETPHQIYAKYFADMVDIPVLSDIARNLLKPNILKFSA